MDSGVRRTEVWTLYDERDRPVIVTALVLVFPGPREARQLESGRTTDDRKIRPHGVGTYIASDGQILTVLPSGDR
jgi:hypothetical protein